MPATVLRVGIGSRGDVDHDGAVHLTGVSPSARFGRPESAVPPCALFGSLTCGAGSSKRERVSTERFLILWILNSAATLEIHRKIITAPKILKICV